MINSGFISVLVLAFIHLFANRAKLVGWIWHGRFLSFAAGVSFAYIFVDLLPALEKGQPVLKRTIGEIVPLFDKHAYVLALIGMLFFYGLHIHAVVKSQTNFLWSIAGYVLFNFFVGASLSDSTNPEIQPVILFTIAMGMHYFIRDHSAGLNNTVLYENQGRWMLIAALFSGYLFGYIAHIPDAVVAVLVSFLSGGILLNVLGYELPKRETVGYWFFVLGSVIYTLILLSLGDA